MMYSEHFDEFNNQDCSVYFLVCREGDIKKNENAFVCLSFCLLARAKKHMNGLNMETGVLVCDVPSI